MPKIKWSHETKITTVEWLWKPFIPANKVTIIQGDGGDGKTTLVLTIAAMLSRGIQPPALENGRLKESQTIDPITIFYATNEDEISDSTLPRYIRAGGDLTKLAYSGELEEHLTLCEEDLNEIIDETKAKLIIVDPWQSFIPKGMHMGNMAQTRALLNMLNNVAKKKECAIILVGHLNKSTGQKDIYRGFGTADVAASVRSVLCVAADKDDSTKRFVWAVKSNFDESDKTRIQLVFDEERRLSFYILPKEDTEYEPNKAESKIEKAKRIVLELIESREYTANEIIEMCGKQHISAKTVRRAKNELGAESVYGDNRTVYWVLD